LKSLSEGTKQKGDAITNNPMIASELTAVYWREPRKRSKNETLHALRGTGISTNQLLFGGPKNGEGECNKGIKPELKGFSQKSK
jgi:hypothetical protein